MFSFLQARKLMLVFNIVTIGDSVLVSIKLNEINYRSNILVYLLS